MKRILVTAVSVSMAVLTLFSGCGKKNDVPQSEFAMLTKGNVELEMGETMDIDVMEYEGQVVWKSSNTNVATVSDEGVITAVTAGSSVVTATLESATELSCMVTVVPGTSNVKTISVSGIYSSANDITASYKDSAYVQLKATCDPYDPDEKLVWKSSDNSRASVDSNGLVTLNGNGEVTITATAYNGVEGKCIVRVKNVPEEVSANQPKDSGEKNNENAVPEIENNYGETSKNRFTSSVPETSPTAESVIVVSDKYLFLSVAEGYTLTYAVGNSEEKECEWMSSDKSVAIVNEDGCVVGVGNGRATISAVTHDGAVAHCVVAVGDKEINQLKEEVGK